MAEGGVALGTVAEFEVDIRRIASGGEGLGYLPDGRVVFVPRSAPGDRIRVSIRGEADRWARGEIEEILSAGASRVVAPCPHYADCGGCALQHLEYPAQLRWKSQMVADALTRIAGIATDAPGIVGSPQELRYRNRISFTLRRLPSGRVLAGFHRRNEAAKLLDIDSECLLPSAALGKTWSSLRASWGPRACHLPGGNPLRLTLREEGSAVALVVEGAKGRGAPDILLAAVPSLTSIWIREEGGAHRLLAGRPGREQDPILSFVQSNPPAFKALETLQIELGAPSPGTRIIDAYAGTGGLGRHLADAGASVVSIESDIEAIRVARAHAHPNQQVLHGLVDDQIQMHLPADLVYLNPPRAGIAPRVAEVLVTDPPAHIVYTSCDPATLARDVKRLGASFAIQSIRCFDLFPQTAQVETVLYLRRVENGNAGAVSPGETG